MRSAWRGLAIVGLVLMALFVVAACGGSSSNESSSTTTGTSGTPQIDACDLTADFSEMSQAQGPC